MGSKSRIPPSHMRRPLPGPDPFGPGIRPPHVAYPPFDMLPPPQVMEQKLAVQHVEMQRLVVENQRLAATHGSLRQELAGAQHELQILHAQIGAIKSEREQQMRGLVDSIAKMEADLKSAEPVKGELQKARAEAQSLVVSRQELIAKVQQLGQDLQRSHADVQQIPALVAQLDGLRQEYQLCRDTYDYEKRLYSNHLESLQGMEKNYVTMAREVEKLRAELVNNSNVDRRTGAPYYGTPGNNDNEATGQALGQNGFEDSYGVQQGRTTFLPAAAAATGSGGAAAAGTPPLVGAQSGPRGRTVYDAPRGPGYDPLGGPGHDAQRGPAYDAHRGPAYDPQRGPAYDPQRGPAYDPQRGSGYDGQRPGYDVQRSGYEVQRVPGYDPTRGVNYDAQSRAAGGGPQGHVPTGNVSYGSATPPARGGTGYEAPPPQGPGGGNPVRR